MKEVLFATAVLAVLGAMQCARAADVGADYQKAPFPPYVAPIYNWTGFYIGGHLGGAFSSDNNFSGLATGNNANGRFLGGVQVGTDWQFASNWVLGAQGQFSWLSGNVGAVFPSGFAYSNEQRGLGSISGRIGYTWGPGLFYVKGGYAFSDNDESVMSPAGIPVPFATSGDHRNGYTVGAGLEYMFAPNWSANVEYQYYNFGNASFVAPPALVSVGSFTTDDHTVKAGVNYRFNWGGPVAPGY